MLALLLVAVAAGVYYLAIRNQPRPAEAEGAIKSIAVLPFKPLGVEENEEVWALGLADALITRLSNLRQIVVRPTSAVLKYVGPDHDPVAVGRELGVDSVLDGKIQKVDDRLRVTVQLLSVRDGAPLWAETFDEQLTSVFAVEDSISAQVTQALILTLSGEEKRQLAKHSTESGEAYQLYLKGRYFWNKRSSEGLEKAIAHFEQAIERDPNYALAYAGLADAYSVIANAPLPQREALPKAREAALKALEIDDTLAEAHTSLAFVKFSYDWDWAGAEREFKRAHELNPNYATAHHWYAYYLIAMGRPDEALAEIRHAQALDPLSLIINTDVGDILAYARRYDEAVEQFRKTLDLDPNFTQAHFNLGLTLERMGQYEDAIAEFQKAIELSERNADMVAALGHVYAIVGRRAEAVAILDELNQRSKREYVLPYDRALIHLGLGQNGPALAWLQKDIDERVVWADRWTADARLDPVRSDPRFAELLRRVRLTDR
jgi:TolB-like protein/Flp pilus assembly protein TadD